jgi:hypothetical protein
VLNYFNFKLCFAVFFDIVRSMEEKLYVRVGSILACIINNQRSFATCGLQGR